MKTKLAGMGGAPTQTFVDDVFSTYLYTGNGSTQTITNGIDLAGKGGMVWVKARSAVTNHYQIDTGRGGSKYINSNNNDFENTITPAMTFNSTGYVDPGFFTSGITQVSWTFRKAAKFFDVVTYTGTGSARTIAHSLGAAPGMVIVKRTDASANWQVYSNGLTSAAYSIQLNSTAAEASAPTVWNSTAPTSSVFSVGTDATVNASGGTYVAYLFAHDTSSTGIIQCGSYTGNGSATGPVVTLGWEPQYLMIKEATAANSWTVFDQMRYLNNNGSGYLTPNSTAVENGTSGLIGVLATGFRMLQSGTLLNQSGQTYIYMAIRRPNKPPTTGTQVFSPVLNTGNGTAGTILTAGFPVDFNIGTIRTPAGYSYVCDMDRLRGATILLQTGTTSAETTDAQGITSFANQTGVVVGTGVNNSWPNQSPWTYVNWMFKRAPGFFDEVCYTGTSSATTQAHNLGVVPELIIIKCRNQARSWAVGTTSIGWTGTDAVLYLEQNVGVQGVNYWNTTNPTSTVFSLGASPIVNGSGNTNVAYLFATLAGIQYINSYVGDGTTGRVINCGFSAGARFICIKATSTTGSWWVWDSARGITSTNDPALQLNSTAAEITSADAIDPSSSGFIVNQEATCSINASGVSYLVWAIA